jgi:hypothetical protein
MHIFCSGFRQTRWENKKPTGFSAGGFVNLLVWLKKILLPNRSGSAGSRPSYDARKQGTHLCDT